MLKWITSNSCAFIDLVEHDEMTGEMVPDAREPKSPGRAGHEMGGRLGASGKKRHIMTLGDKLFCQPRDNAFGAAVKPGRHRF
jgi:hypothetical protein